MFATRVTRADTVLDPTGIPMTAAAPGPSRPPAVAFDGTNYLVVWEDTRSGIGAMSSARE